MPTTQALPIRLPRKGEEGTPFIHWLDGRARANRQARERMIAFIQQWDHARDDVWNLKDREMTLEDYAEYWSVPEPTAYRHLAEFRKLTGIKAPADLCQLLWDGIPRGPGEPVPLLKVRVVDES
jgi:hypothetical protein